MQATAQLTTVVEVDVTRLAAYRDAVKSEFQAKTGDKLSFLPFFAVAAVEALQAFPIINATVDGSDIVYPASENISIAVDTDHEPRRTAAMAMTTMKRIMLRPRCRRSCG